MPSPGGTTMKERILETADRLFYLQGIRAIGVDTIAAEVGISKRTLYNHFPSKDALIAAYLARRFVKPRPSDKPPVEQILATFDSLERRFASRDFRGCPFVNAVAELGAQDKSVKKTAVAFKESRRLWFRDLLRQLEVADPEGLATQLTLLVDGSIAQDLVRDDPATARAAKDAARVLLANAGVGFADQQSAPSPRKRRAQPTYQFAHLLRLVFDFCNSRAQLVGQVAALVPAHLIHSLQRFEKVVLQHLAQRFLVLFRFGQCRRQSGNHARQTQQRHSVQFFPARLFAQLLRRVHVRPQQLPVHMYRRRFAWFHVDVYVDVPAMNSCAHRLPQAVLVFHQRQS